MVTTEDFKAPYYNLKSMLDRKNVTQQELAEVLGIDRGTFNLKINRKNGRDFTLSEAAMIAKYLDEKVHDFF